MILGELLTILRRDILHDWSDQINGTTDQLWTDTTLINYINEAQNQFVRKTGYAHDANEAFTQITLVTNVDTYKLNSIIIAVLSAQLEGTSIDLTRTNHNVINKYSKPDGYFFDVHTLTQLSPGKPLAFSTDEYLDNDIHGSIGVMVVKLYPKPSIEYNGQKLNLRVARKVLQPLTQQTLDAVPEIPEEYHFMLLDYAAYLALRIVDHDAGDVKRSFEFLATWKEQLEAAKIQLRRKLFAPMAWGIGRNGFVWNGNGGYW